MKRTDRLLQRWRIAKAARYVPAGARVLDIGCFDGTLFRQLADRVGAGIGIDPTLPGSHTMHAGRFELIAGRFPDDLPDTDPFDVITMLAVLEHFPVAEARQIARDCAQRLKPGGQLIITVPAPVVDRILDFLKLVRVIDGMGVEEHHGFDALSTPTLFASEAFSLQRAERFQLGLNNLFVFTRRAVQ
jgi:SAM-dependent methyltransferase